MKPTWKNSDLIRCQRSKVVVPSYHLFIWLVVTWLFSTDAVCLSHMALISIPLSRSLSPCRKNSSMILSVHWRYSGSALVGLLRSAQCTMFLSTCTQENVEKPRLQQTLWTCRDFHLMWDWPVFALCSGRAAEHRSSSPSSSPPWSSGPPAGSCVWTCLWPTPAERDTTHQNEFHQDPWNISLGNLWKCKKKQKTSWICVKMQWGHSWPMSHPLTKFRELLLKTWQTDKLTNRHKHELQLFWILNCRLKLKPKMCKLKAGTTCDVDSWNQGFRKFLKSFKMVNVIQGTFWKQWTEATE